MDENRKVAYKVLIDIDKNIAYSNIALNKFINKFEPDKPSFVRELVYGVLKNKLYIDNIIDSLAKRGIKKIKVNVLNIIRMGVYQIKFMDSVPDYAAVDECVKLSKKFAYGSDKFVNGILREYIRNKFNDFLPKDTKSSQYLSLKYSINISIVEFWLQQFEFDVIEDILKTSNQTPSMSIRYNRLKTDRESLKKELLERGYEVATSQSETCLNIRGRNLIDTDLYEAGLFTVQDEASQLVAQIISAEPGDEVLDMCAAPGGKTFAMAECMNNEGVIIAQDIYEHKLELIKKGAERLNIKNIKTKCKNSCKIEDSYIQKFDKVLCDVPCSGLGVIRRKPEIKFKDVDFDELYKTQECILDNAAKYVKTSGALLYSTCTINKYENEYMILRFLREHDNFDCVYEKQYLPNIDGTDGFFMAKLVKNK